MRHILWFGIMMSVLGCVAEPPANSDAIKVSQAQLDQGGHRFRQVMRRVEPIAEQECRARVPELSCDFKIVIDDRPNLPSNAYQSEEHDGQPVITFTLALLADARNADELAFVLGHEAAHHIQGHLKQTRQNATVGGVLGIIVAASVGVDLEIGADLGSFGGARGYSKKFELQADQLGTIISHKAGYDPVKGAAFFNRIPDPGDKFLGSHPPNAQRIEIVKETAAQL